MVKMNMDMDYQTQLCQWFNETAPQPQRILLCIPARHVNQTGILGINSKGLVFVTGRHPDNFQSEFWDREEVAEIQVSELKDLSRFTIALSGEIREFEVFPMDAEEFIKKWFTLPLDQTLHAGNIEDSAIGDDGINDPVLELGQEDLVPKPSEQSPTDNPIDEVVELGPEDLITDPALSDSEPEVNTDPFNIRLEDIIATPDASTLYPKECDFEPDEVIIDDHFMDSSTQSQSNIQPPHGQADGHTIDVGDKRDSSPHPPDPDADMDVEKPFVMGNEETVEAPELKTNCPACGSHRVVTGNLESRSALMFKPDGLKQMNLKRFVKLLAHCIPVNARGAICLDCGLFWSETSIDNAIRMLKELGQDELIQALEL